MATLQNIYPVLKNEQTGKSIQCCARGCKRVARHVHHVIPRCMGGSDDTLNTCFLCQKCHTALHSEYGHYRDWGKIGGQRTAATMKSIPNLIQFRGEAGRARWERFCQQRANAQMGLAS